MQQTYNETINIDVYNLLSIVVEVPRGGLHVTVEYIPYSTYMRAYDSYKSSEYIHMSEYKYAYFLGYNTGVIVIVIVIYGISL